MELQALIVEVDLHLVGLEGDQVVDPHDAGVSLVVGLCCLPGLAAVVVTGQRFVGSERLAPYRRQFLRLDVLTRTYHRGANPDS